MSKRSKSEKERMTRRRFFERAGAGGLALSLSAGSPGCSEATELRSNEQLLNDPIPTRTLGKTGETVTMIGLGGWNMGRIEDEKLALDVIHRSLDLGVSFFDSAWDYQDGESERRLGIGLKGKRDEVFLMTKVHKRDREGALEQLHESLKRLQTDHLDLWQFHSIKQVEEVDKIFGPGGAMEAAYQAQKDGKIRYVGITGHYDPRAHLRALDFHEDLDTIQFPINCVDPSSGTLSFVNQVLPRAAEHNLGILAMKTIAMGRIIRHGAATVDEALRYAWSKPISVLISGFDQPAHVEHNVAQAKQFTPMSGEEQKALTSRVASFATPKVEYYKKELAQSVL